ncbi:MAG: SIR2 family protein [Gammaproteobacteria bacterium]
MLLVIFGAGASHDSAPARSLAFSQFNNLADRPPLANQLFDDRPDFREDLDLFPQCKRIVPLLRNANAASAFEQTLHRLQMEGQGYAPRFPQLAAVRFYLRRMLWRCEDRWYAQHRDVTNYATLLDHLGMWRRASQPILLVTFNYDRMLERALKHFNQAFTEIPHYIESKRFLVFKLHGSVNWGHRLQTQIVTENRGWPDIAHELIQQMAHVEFTDEYVVLDHHDIVNDRARVYFPAVALPVEQKVTFECPESHVNALRENLPHVTRILTIGWRGTENTFLDLLKGHLPYPVPIQVIAKDGLEATAIGHHLNGRRIALTIDAYPSGFTDYVVSRDGEGFLRD